MWWDGILFIFSILRILATIRLMLSVWLNHNNVSNTKTFIPMKIFSVKQGNVSLNFLRLQEDATKTKINEFKCDKKGRRFITWNNWTKSALSKNKNLDFLIHHKRYIMWKPLQISNQYSWRSKLSTNDRLEAEVDESWFCIQSW